MESQNKADVSELPDQGEAGTRSTIEFPYTDLDNGVETVRGVHLAGGTACDYDQLAGALNVEARGGGFRLRVNGAKSYGLVTYERGGRITMTDLGRRIIDSAHERGARVEAFLTVPLFAKVFETYKGSPLPPQPALERSMISMGVGSKVADRARQVLLRSAKQAGFFDMKSDRLIAPARGSGEGATAAADSSKKGERKGGPGDGGGGHPLIEGLLQTLPEPGGTWSSKDRFNWLNMANSIFKIIYQSEDVGDVAIDYRHSGIT